MIQPEKMEDVLWDVMRMQFLAEEKALVDTTMTQEEQLNVLTHKVFAIHKITSKKFEDSYNWYVKHPTVLKRIFDSMQVKKQQAFDNKHKIEESEELLVDSLLPESDKGRNLERRDTERMEAIE